MNSLIVGLTIFMLFLATNAQKKDEIKGALDKK